MKGVAVFMIFLEISLLLVVYFSYFRGFGFWGQVIL